jgi:hypothetical protein
MNGQSLLFNEYPRVRRAAIDAETAAQTAQDYANEFAGLVYNRITIGGYGAAVSVCPPHALPPGMTELPGTKSKLSDEYGNYQYIDGSLMVYVAMHYYKVGTGANGLAVNEIEIADAHDFEDRAEAEAAGFALDRAFINGGSVMQGVFVDKYLCSKVANGSGFSAGSIKFGLPISTSSAHNPIADLSACAGNAYYEVVNAAKGRDGVNGAVNAESIFFCNTRFIRAMLARLSMAHGQASTSTAHCAWYDAGGTTNFPKGCNNNALGDANDGEIAYVSDGYSNCGQTGSGTPFAKTTHNGQACGIADLNGNMWEIELGLTRPGSSPTDTTNQNDTAAFYMLKESVRVEDLTAGWNAGNDAWGDATHLATLYDAIDIPYVINTGVLNRFGSGANQVLSEAISGDGYRLAGLGFPKDSNARSGGGTNLFGADYFYEYHRANLPLISGGAWDYGSTAGVWTANLTNYRSYSSTNVGFRCACYPV